MIVTEPLNCVTFFISLESKTTLRKSLMVRKSAFKSQP